MHASYVFPHASPLEQLEPLLMIVAVILAIYLVGAPLLVKSTVKQSAVADLVLLGPGDADPTVPLDEPRARLRELGFEYVGTLRYTGTSGHAQMYIVLMKNPAERDLALAVMTFRRTDLDPTWKPVQQHLEFVSKFSEDVSLCSNNNGIMPVFAAVPGKQIERFPMVREARQLHRIHRKLVEPYGEKSKQRVVDEDPVALLRKSVRREMEGQVRTGYFQLDGAQDAYVPTWKGAFLMTWKMLPPVKQIRRALRERRARGLLAELGEAC